MGVRISSLPAASSVNGTDLVPIVQGGVNYRATAAQFLAAGDVNTVTNSDGTLTISPTTGAVVASLNPAHANSWTATQTFRNVAVAPAAATGTPTQAVAVTAAAHTALTAGTEWTPVSFDLSATVQFATGAVTTQRALRVLAPTYAFVGASTITAAATVAISGAPVAGTNATITKSYAFQVNTGFAAGIGVVVQGASSQSGNLQEWQNNSGTVLASVSAAGVFQINSSYGTVVTDADGATITFDLSASDRHTVTLGGARTLALSNGVDGQSFMIVLVQDGTGSRTVTWFSGIKWPGGLLPTLTTTAGKKDVFSFQRLSSGEYLNIGQSQNL